MSIIIADQWADGERVKKLSVIVNGEYWDIYNYEGVTVYQERRMTVKDIKLQGKHMIAVVDSFKDTEDLLDYIRLSYKFVGETLQKWDNGEIDRSELACSIHESADWLASMARELSFIGE